MDPHHDQGQCRTVFLTEVVLVLEAVASLKGLASTEEPNRLMAIGLLALILYSLS